MQGTGGGTGEPNEHSQVEEAGGTYAHTYLHAYVCVWMCLFVSMCVLCTVCCVCAHVTCWSVPAVRTYS